MNLKISRILSRGQRWSCLTCGNTKKMRDLHETERCTECYRPVKDAVERMEMK